MPLLKGLPPLLPKSPRVLILGSMPSARSLAAGEYYAHPQNAFWPVLAAVLQTPLRADYAARAAAAQRAGVAIWDVLAACAREGSMDSAIEKDSEQPNDIGALLKKYPSILAVALNGGRAKQCFMRHIKLSGDAARIKLLFLPSTSPANARLTRAQKTAAWQQIAPFLRKKSGAGE